MNLVSTTTPLIMAKLTVCKCGRQASSEKDPTISSKSGKCVPVSKYRAPLPPTKNKSTSKAKDLPEVEDTEYIEDSEPETVKDISNKTYSLHKSIMLMHTVF